MECMSSLKALPLYIPRAYIYSKLTFTTYEEIGDDILIIGNSTTIDMSFLLYISLITEYVFIIGQ